MDGPMKINMFEKWSAEKKNALDGWPAEKNAFEGLKRFESFAETALSVQYIVC